MKEIKEILGGVSKRIIPSRRRISDVEKFEERLKKRIKKSLKAKVELGGSYAKGTFLKNDFDVDFFVLFDRKYPNEQLSSLLEEVLRPFNPARVHGSRDYFQIKKGKLMFEVVPVYGIKSVKEAVNITDCSPLHVHWANRKGKKLKDEIRLAKKFCKAQKIYGAESYIQGISGHVLDILVIHYGGFLNLLKSAAIWKPKVVIDTENAHRGNALKRLNKAKIQSPLIVVDPIEPNRNAAAAVSETVFARFVQAAKRFLESPKKEFFEERKLTPGRVRKKFPDALIIRMRPLKAKRDVAGSKLRQIVEFIAREVKEFGIEEFGWEWDGKSDAVAFFSAKEKELSPYKEIKGPLLSQEMHVANFRKKHANTFEKGGRIWAKEKRKHRKPESRVLEIIKSDYCTQRCEKVYLV